MTRNVLRALPAPLLLTLCLSACSPTEDESRQRAGVIDPRAETTVEKNAPIAVPPIAASALQAEDPATPAAAEAVVRDYYAAINARDFAGAHAHWSDYGAASGQSLEAFAKGYTHTQSVEATVGKATAEEGAAGSRYILVPVALKSMQADGSTRAYRGFFTLRAVVADGAPAEQRRWHLAAAEMERLAD